MMYLWCGAFPYLVYLLKDRAPVSFAPADPLANHPPRFLDLAPSFHRAPRTPKPGPVTLLSPLQSPPLPPLPIPSNQPAHWPDLLSHGIKQ